jgi:regulator of nucleoside diphosphate kinase
LDDLVGELDRALIVAPHEVPGDVVTMNSKIQLVDAETAEEMEIALVFPEDTDSVEGAVSILAPVGTAIIGYSEGDSVEWPTPSGTRTLRIERVLFQPEAAGEWDL